MPSFTIISCALAVVENGGVPVVVDCDPNTWCMDVHQIERKITARTRAIMPVHIWTSRGHGSATGNSGQAWTVRNRRRSRSTRSGIPVREEIREPFLAAMRQFRYIELFQFLCQQIDHYRRRRYGAHR